MTGMVKMIEKAPFDEWWELQLAANTVGAARELRDVARWAWNERKAMDMTLLVNAGMMDARKVIALDGIPHSNPAAGVPPT